MATGTAPRTGPFSENENKALTRLAQYLPAQAARLRRTGTAFWKCVLQCPEGAALRSRTPSAIVRRYRKIEAREEDNVANSGQANEGNGDNRINDKEKQRKIQRANRPPSEGASRPRNRHSGESDHEIDERHSSSVPAAAENESLPLRKRNKCREPTDGPLLDWSPYAAESAQSDVCVSRPPVTVRVKVPECFKRPQQEQQLQEELVAVTVEQPEPKRWRPQLSDAPKMIQVSTRIEPEEQKEELIIVKPKKQQPRQGNSAQTAAVSKQVEIAAEVKKHRAAVTQLDAELQVARIHAQDSIARFKELDRGHRAAQEALILCTNNLNCARNATLLKRYLSDPDLSEFNALAVKTSSGDTDAKIEMERLGQEMQTAYLAQTETQFAEAAAEEAAKSALAAEAEARGAFDQAKEIARKQRQATARLNDAKQRLGELSEQESSSECDIDLVDD